MARSTPTDDADTPAEPDNTETTAAAISAQRARGGRAEFILAPVAATCLALATLAAVWFLADADSWVHVLVFERSWIQYANTFFFWLAIVLLLFRWLRYRREMEACQALSAELDSGHDGDMNWQTAFTLSDRLSTPEFRKWQLSLVFSRVTRALTRLEKTQSTGEMREYMRVRSDIDSEELDSAYTGIRYLSWLIPTLGFVGTVLGISKGINGCGEIVQQAMQAANEMPDVSTALGALGTAFDTTFLALIYSAVAVFHMSFQLKFEEQLLEHIDHICIDEVCGRFQEHSTINDDLIRHLERMEAAIVRNIHGDRAEICRAITDHLPGHLATAISEVIEVLKVEQQKQGDEMVASLGSLAQRAGTGLGRDLRGVAEDVAERAQDHNHRIAQALERLEQLLSGAVVAVESVGDQAEPAPPQPQTPGEAGGEPPPPGEAGGEPPPPPDDDTPGDGWGNDDEDDMQTETFSFY